MENRNLVGTLVLSASDIKNIKKNLGRVKDSCEFLTMFNDGDALHIVKASDVSTYTTLLNGSKANVSMNARDFYKILNSIKLGKNKVAKIEITYLIEMDWHWLGVETFINGVASGFKGRITAFNYEECIHHARYAVGQTLITIPKDTFNTIKDAHIISFRDGKLYFTNTRILNFIECDYPEVLEGQGFNGAPLKTIVSSDIEIVYRGDDIVALCNNKKDILTIREGIRAEAIYPKNFEYKIHFTDEGKSILNEGVKMLEATKAEHIILGYDKVHNEWALSVRYNDNDAWIESEYILDGVSIEELKDGVDITKFNHIEMNINFIKAFIEQDSNDILLQGLDLHCAFAFGNYVAMPLSDNWNASFKLNVFKECELSEARMPLVETPKAKRTRSTKAKKDVPNVSVSANVVSETEISPEVIETKGDIHNDASINDDVIAFETWFDNTINVFDDIIWDITLNTKYRYEAYKKGLYNRQVNIIDNDKINFTIEFIAYKVNNQFSLEITTKKGDKILDSFKDLDSFKETLEIAMSYQKEYVKNAIRFLETHRDMLIEMVSKLYAEKDYNERIAIDFMLEDLGRFKEMSQACKNITQKYAHIGYLDSKNEVYQWIKAFLDNYTKSLWYEQDFLSEAREVLGDNILVLDTTPNYSFISAKLPNNKTLYLEFVKTGAYDDAKAKCGFYNVVSYIDDSKKDYMTEIEYGIEHIMSWVEKTLKLATKESQAQFIRDFNSLDAFKEYALENMTNKELEKHLSTLDMFDNNTVSLFLENDLNKTFKDVFVENGLSEYKEFVSNIQSWVTSKTKIKGDAKTIRCAKKNMDKFENYMIFTLYQDAQRIIDAHKLDINEMYRKYNPRLMYIHEKVKGYNEAFFTLNFIKILIQKKAQNVIDYVQSQRETLATIDFYPTEYLAEKYENIIAKDALVSIGEDYRVSVNDNIIYGYINRDDGCITKRPLFAKIKGNINLPISFKSNVSLWDKFNIIKQGVKIGICCDYANVQSKIIWLEGSNNQAKPKPILGYKIVKLKGAKARKFNRNTLRVIASPQRKVA